MEGIGTHGSGFEAPNVTYRTGFDAVEDEDDGVDPGWDYPVYLTDRDTESPTYLKEFGEDTDETPWHEVASKVRSLRELTHDKPGLVRAHRAAVHLDEKTGTARRGLGTADVLPLLAAARYFAEEVDRADIPELLRQGIAKETGELAALLGARFGEAVRTDRDRVPLWLDVASPTHGRINVAGERHRFPAGHVETRGTTALVAADNCELRTVDHYHVRRVTLDCESLHRDGPALEAFVAVLVDPSEENIAALRERLREIVQPDAVPDVQMYHQQLPARVETRSDQDDVVFLGDSSTVRSTTRYHIRETVVPLADLLHHRPGLIEALAEEYVHGVSPIAILAALGDVDDMEVLRHARGLDDGETSVTHDMGTVRVGLASAVMIGYGNRITASTTVKTGKPKEGNLSRFDEMVRTQVEARLVEHRPRNTTPWSSDAPVNVRESTPRVSGAASPDAGVTRGPVQPPTITPCSPGMGRRTV